MSSSVGDVRCSGQTGSGGAVLSGQLLTLVGRLARHRFRFWTLVIAADFSSQSNLLAPPLRGLLLP
jgi:hypothetical protein